MGPSEAASDRFVTGAEKRPRVGPRYERPRRRCKMEVKIRFFVDPATGQPHIENHAVDEQEVEEVLSEPGDDFPGRRDSRIALGQTEAGRHLQVIYVPDAEPNTVFVITAYELKGKALSAYRR